MQSEFGKEMKTHVPPPFFHPFPTRTTDVYAGDIERETRTYFETHMEVPRLPPLRNDIPTRHLDTRETRRDLAERLVEPTSFAFQRLRDDLRPNATAREIDLESQRRTVLSTAIDREMDGLRRYEVDAPITCGLSDAMVDAIGHSARPRYRDDSAWMAQKDLLDAAFCGLEREKRTNGSFSHLRIEGWEMAHLNAMQREGTRMDMPCSLGTLSLVDPTVSYRQPAEVLAYQQRMPGSSDLQAASVSEGHRPWTPEKIPSRTVCPSRSPQLRPFSQLDLRKMGMKNDAHDDDPQSFHPIRSAILNPSSCAVPSVLQEILENAPDVEISAPRSCFRDDAKGSFEKVMSEFANQEVDIQTLPPVAWPSDDPVIPEGLSMPRTNDASRPVAHLDLYLQWKLHNEESHRHLARSFVPEIETTLPIAGSRDSRNWTDLFRNMGPSSELLTCQSVSCQLTEAAPVYSSQTSSVTKRENGVGMQDPAASHLQYLLKLRGQYKNGRVADGPVSRLAEKSATRSSAQPSTFASQSRPWRKPHLLNVEMTPMIEELLNKMHEGHAMLLAALPQYMSRHLSTDLFDLRSFQENVLPCGTGTAPSTACMEIRVLREASWYLLHLGISAAYHHLKKEMKSRSQSREVCGDCLKELRIGYRNVLNRDTIDHPKDIKLKEILSNTFREVIPEGRRKICLLSDAFGHSSLLRKFPVVQQLIRKQGSAETSLSDQQPFAVILAAQQDFCSVASRQAPLRLSDFDALIEMAPSMYGPTLDTLLQQEALSEAAIDMAQSKSMICLRSQKPQFKTKKLPRVLSNGMPATQAVAKQRSKTKRQQRTPNPIRSAQHQRSEVPFVDDHMKRTQQRIETDASRSTCLSIKREPLTPFLPDSEIKRTDHKGACAGMEVSSWRELKDTFDPSSEHEQSGVQDWNAFKFTKKSRDPSERQDSHSIHQYPLDDKDHEKWGTPCSELGTTLDSTWDRTSTADWNWNFDFLFDGDDEGNAVFDSTFSTGLDSMTEISGLEETTSQAKVTGFDWDTISFPEIGCHESRTEMAYPNDSSLSRTSSCHLTEKMSRAEQPTAKNNKRAPLSRNGLFPDYKRLKRTKTTKKRQQPHWIDLEEEC